MNILIILAFTFVFSSCAKNLNKSYKNATKSSNYSKLPSVKLNSKLDATAENEESITTVLSESCLTLNQYNQVYKVMASLIEKKSIPVESLIDGRSENDKEDLWQLLSFYNDAIKKENSKCALINLMEVVKIKKNYGSNGDYIGLEIRDKNNLFCFPCVDKKMKKIEGGIKKLATTPTGSKT